VNYSTVIHGIYELILFKQLILLSAYGKLTKPIIGQYLAFNLLSWNWLVMFFERTMKINNTNT